MLFLGMWLAGTVALAQEEVCQEVYDNAGLMHDLEAVDASFRGLKVDEARNQLSGIHRRMLCLDEPADRDGLARLARQLSLTFFFDQDEDAMRRWGRMAGYIAPELPWPGDLGEDHSFRSSIGRLSSPEIGGPDRGLAVPRGGGLLWNGELVTSTRVPVEMPGLVQVFDKKGAVQSGWWQDGSAWPERVLTNQPPSAIAPPRGWTNPVPDPAHARSAARPLFESAPTLSPVNPERDPGAYTEQEIAEARESGDAGSYVDPFADARRRAIRRDVFESTMTTEDGGSMKVRTEVMSFKRDRSGGEPITNEIYVYWSRDLPDWKPVAVRSRGLADEGFLQHWDAEGPATEVYGQPLVHVSFAVAQGYCRSFGSDLPAAAQNGIHEDLGWEFRLEGAEAVRVGPGGRTQPVDSRQTYDDTGFRCVQ